jgi:hypothetical protein
MRRGSLARHTQLQAEVRRRPPGPTYALDGTSAPIRLGALRKPLTQSHGVELSPDDLRGREDGDYLADATIFLTVRT